MAVPSPRKYLEPMKTNSWHPFALVACLALMACGGKSLDTGPDPRAPTITSFTVEPSSVNAGVATDIHWTWTYAESPTPSPICTLDPGSEAIENGSVHPVTLSMETTFTLDCSNSAGSDAAQATLRPSLQVPATSVLWEQEYSAEIEGSGDRRVTAVSVEGNTGTVRLDGEEIPVVVYLEFYWEYAGILTYTLLGVQEDRLSTFWAYCDNEGNLTQIWYETSDGTPVAYTDASGACANRAEPSASLVEFPPLDLPIPKLLDGFSIEGSDLTWNGEEPGLMDLAGEAWLLYPYNLVDCTEICGDPGAWELHSLLWNPATLEACFGIVYLWEPPEEMVSLDLGLCLPSLDTPGGVFDATYSAPSK